MNKVTTIEVRYIEDIVVKGLLDGIKWNFGFLGKEIEKLAGDSKHEKLIEQYGYVKEQIDHTYKQLDYITHVVHGGE